MKKRLYHATFIDPTVKKLNNPDYHYLKLWNEEAKPKKEKSKDLPKLNQVRSHLQDRNAPGGHLKCQK